MTAAYAVRLTGHAGDLLVTRQDSPRGGFQTRIFAYAGGKVTEVTAQGRPLVPFVATDVPQQPTSVDCQGGRIVVSQAVGARPAGTTWTVRQTAYALDGATASPAGPGPTTGRVPVKDLRCSAPSSPTAGGLSPRVRRRGSTAPASGGLAGVGDDDVAERLVDPRHQLGAGSARRRP